MKHVKKTVRKVKIAKNLLVSEGILAVGIRSLEFIQKKTSRKHLYGKSGGRIVDVGAPYDEVLVADPSKPANSGWSGLKKESMTFNWLMPPPGKGSGGHMTIFRFIKYPAMCLSGSKYPICSLRDFVKTS